MTIKTVPLALNLDDPDQLLMWQHISARTNRSAYLKRLVWQDMRGGTPVAAMRPDDPGIDESLMEGMI